MSKPRRAPSRVQTDPRLRSRRKEVERQRRIRALIGVGVLALAGGLVWVAFFSPLLEVERVRLLGSKHTSKSEVFDATGVRGDNLLLLSTSRLESDIADLPWVAEAKVDRILPDTVRVTVKERTPALVIEGLRGSWTVDPDGRVLQSGSVRGLPVLEAAVTGSLRPGAEVTNDGAVAVLRMWRSLPTKLRSRVVAIFAPSAERISFSLTDRTLIRYGSAHMLVAKARVLKALLARLAEQGRGAAYIDVRVPSSPAIAPAAPSPTVSPTPATSPTT